MRARQLRTKSRTRSLLVRTSTLIDTHTIIALSINKGTPYRYQHTVLSLFWEAPINTTPKQFLGIAHKDTVMEAVSKRPGLDLRLPESRGPGFRVQGGVPF